MPVAMRSKVPSALRHFPAAALFAVFALAFTYPLVTQLETHVPGRGPGDNVSFLWNLHRMREAIASADEAFFFTNVLFYPVGFDLTLHTHTAFHALLAATVFAGLPVVAAQNLLILLSVGLNGLFTYALAVEEHASRAAAAVAGLVFASAPFFSAHLVGHFNLVAAYGLPLVALMVLRAIRRQSRMHAVGAGMALVLLGYTDYYLTLFAIAMATCLATLHARRPVLSHRPSGPRRLFLARSSAAILVLLVGLIALISITGGGVFQIAGVPLSARGTFNLQTAAGLVLVLLFVLRWRVQLELKPKRDGGVLGLCLLGAMIFLTGVAPLIWRGLQLWAQGRYVSPTFFWRSAPPGQDLLALFLPNLRHPLVGSASLDRLEAWQLNPIESAPLGVVVTVLLAAAWRARSHDPAAQHWWPIATLFFVWSLGPFLRIGGIGTGVVCPQGVLRLLPVLENARIPGRALVVCQLAAALLIAGRVATVSAVRRRRFVAGAIGLAVCTEYAAWPLPTYELPSLPIESSLAGGPPGAILEIPLGIQDGFGVRGLLDPVAVYAQTVHGRPIAGGAASRVPRSVDAAYQELPVLGSLLQLSSGQSVPSELIERDRREGRAALEHLGFAYVLVRRPLAAERLARYPVEVLGLAEIGRSADEVLYAVRPH